MLDSKQIPQRALPDKQSNTAPIGCGRPVHSHLDKARAFSKDNTYGLFSVSINKCGGNLSKVDNAKRATTHMTLSPRR